MKIGILTLPLYCNYGGIMQCYALQTILQRMGHETFILQREFNPKHSIIGACIFYTKHFLKLLLGRNSSWHYYVDPKRHDFIAKNTYQFIEKNINPRSKHCYTTKELRQEFLKQEIDAIIVGSDQVWRSDFSPCLPNYYLDFIGNDCKIKKISYGASFGSDKWNYSNEQTILCGKLLQQFDFVSVRESSGIKLCKEHFHLDAKQVVDPTLLLEPKDYQALLSSNQMKRGNLFCYILDKSKEKKEIINLIATKNNFKPFESMPLLSDTTYNLYKDIDKCVYPPIEKWLSAFMEADMVLTDSFHGTVFSIIFNKPFWVIGNKERGMARFDSILSLFNLKNRFIVDYEHINLNINEPIEWSSVNKKRQELKKESIQFLLNALQ